MNIKTKYDGRGSHRRAILHMIGQSVEVFKQPPTTAEIAAWMNVTKPTARKYLKRLVKSRELIMNEIPYRPNGVVKHTWQLHDEILHDYMRGALKADYQIWSSRVLGVIGL